MNHPSAANRIALSSWALHPLIKRVAPGRPNQPEIRMMGDSGEAATLDILEMPAALAIHGIRRAELCHFHVPSTETAYLADLRGKFDDAGVELWTLLIDDGDMASEADGTASRDWIAHWIAVAGQLGAVNARIIAGKQPPTPENFDRAVQHFQSLLPVAQNAGVHLNTENWFALLPDAAAVLRFLEAMEGKIGLCVDFGNWTMPTKYAELARIASHGTACHAKCHFANGLPDTADYAACIAALRDTGYAAPYTIVYGEPASVWESIATQTALIHAEIA